MGDARKPDRRKDALALQYEPSQDAAPRVVAKGRGLVAEKILEIAKAHGIPIREDRELVEMLCRLDLNQEIPSDLYRVVAELLAWVYRLNTQRAALRPGDGEGGSTSV